MNEQALRFRIGVFVLASLLLLAVLITLFGSFPRLFVRSNEYTVVFDDAPGVEQGTPVRRSGVRVGEVKRVTLDNETGKVHVLIVIDHQYTLRHSDRPTLVHGLLGGDTSIDFVPPRGEGENVDNSPVPPGAELAGARQPTMNTLLTEAQDVLPTTQEALNNISKAAQRYEKMAPLLEDTAREYRDLAKATREMVPELKKTNEEVREMAKATRTAVPKIEKAATEIGDLAHTTNDFIPELRKTNDEVRELAKATRETVPEVKKTAMEVGELAKATRETIPDLKKTNDQAQAALITWTRTGERVKLILDRNEDKINEAVDLFNDDLKRVGNVLSDDNQRNLTAALKNLRAGSDNLASVSKKADDVMGNLQQATKPFAERGPSIVKNVDEGTARLNAVLADVQELLKAIDRGDGTLKRLITDPSLYNHLDEAACIVTKLLPKLEPILRNVNVFTDKIARHPESLGVRGSDSTSTILIATPDLWPPPLTAAAEMLPSSCLRTRSTTATGVWSCADGSAACSATRRFHTIPPPLSRLTVERLEDRTVPSATLMIGLNGPSSVMAGGQISYTLNVSNMGPDAAQNIDLTDLLPSGVSFVSQSQTSGPAFSLSYSGGQVSDTLAALPADSSASFSVVVSVPASTPNHTSLVDQAGVTTTTQLSTYSLTSASVTTTVQNYSAPASTTLTLTSSANPSPFGQAVTFTAVVASPAGGTPTGSVSFADDGTALGTAALSVVNGHDQATLSTSALALGFHTMTAVYGGDGTFQGSSNTLLQNVQPVISWVGPTFTWSQSQSPPVVTNPGARTNAEGDTVSLQVAATDPNGYALSYDAVNLPAGLAINAGTGQITGSIGYQAAEDFGGSYPVSVLVTDAQGGGTEVSFTWTVTDTPRLPVITPVGNQTNAAGDSVSVQVGATQPDGDPLSYDADGLPSGLDIDADTGLISGTIDPSAGSATPYTVTVIVTDSTPDTPQTASATFTWAVGAATPAPALDSPGDQVNAAGDVVDLPLSGSDAGGYALTYTATGLPAGLGIDPGTGEITGTVAASAVSTTPYAVTVTASDGQAASSQTFHWTVGGVSLAGPGDQQNVDGAAVSLPVTASDAANNSLTFSATGLPSGLSINSGTGVISGTLAGTADAASPYSVTVTATDGATSASTSFTWEVDRLTLTAPADQQNRDGDTVSLQLSATDLAGAPTYSATGLPAGLSLNAGTGLISGTVGVAAHGQSPYQVTVTATDGAASSSQSFVWTVTPQVVLLSPGPQQSAAGDAVSLTVTASDRASGTLTYGATGLPGGLSISATTGVISGTVAAGAVSASPYTVTVTASDGTYSASQMFNWSVAVISLAAPGDQTNLDDDAVSLALGAGYHGGGTLSWSASGLPAGLGINPSTGLISGTLANTADANGPYAVTVTATDGSASTSESFTWEVDPRVSIDAIDDQANVQGDTISLAVSASDAAPGSQALTYSATGLPGGLSINTGTGLISGQLTASFGSGPFAVTVTVGDGTASASQTFSWSVVSVTLANPGDQVSVGGATVSLALSADWLAPYTSPSFSAIGLPAGLSINGTTGVISGTLSAGDTGHSYLVTATATAAGASSSQTFTWRVGAVVVQLPADQTNTEGDSVSMAVSAWAASGTLSYSATGLPAGLSINANTGVISGTIAAGAAADGPYTVTVAASNGSAADNQTYSWTVNPRVVVNSIGGQSNQEGDGVLLQVTASEQGATLSYAAAGLPAGLSINSSTGLISGTVAAGASAGGPYPVDVTVTDGTYSTDVEFGWAITNGTISVPILTTPGWQVSVAGDSVNLAVSANDPAGDTFTYSADGLPDGLTIDPISGIISGTVAVDAVSITPYLVTLTADDGDGNTATGTFFWGINDSALAVQGPGAGQGSPVSITATEGLGTGEVTVATFADTDPNWSTSSFTATIAWGDGTTDTGDVDGSNGSFTVSGSHVYADPGTYSPQVTVTDGFTTVTLNGTATVNPAALTVTGGVQQGAVVASAVSGDWASFTDGDPADAASSYTATISWGDNSAPTTGTVTGSDGEFVVSGSHAYATVGVYSVTVMVVNPEGTSGSATSTAQVGDIYAGVNASLTVASFTSNDPNAAAGQFTATVNWGDGSASSNATVTGSNGVFTVHGSHTYAVDSLDQPGCAYPVTVTVQGPYGASLNTTRGVRVERPQMQGAGEEILAQPGVAFSNAEVATFTEPDLSDGTGEFTAMISWGDGTASAATVIGSGGVFHILGSHTYTMSGDFTIQVNVSQAWGVEILVAELVGGASVSQVGDRTIPTNGAGVVPANSTYSYIAWIKDAVLGPQSTHGIPEGEITNVRWVVTGPASKTEESPLVYTSAPKEAIGFEAEFTFENKPGVVTIHVEFDVTVNGVTTHYKSTDKTVVVFGFKMGAVIKSDMVGNMEDENSSGWKFTPRYPNDLPKTIPWEHTPGSDYEWFKNNADKYGADREHAIVGSVLAKDPNTNTVFDKDRGKAAFYTAMAIKLLAPPGYEPNPATANGQLYKKIQVGFIQQSTDSTGSATYKFTENGPKSYRVQHTHAGNSLDWAAKPLTKSGIPINENWPWVSANHAKPMADFARPEGATQYSALITFEDSPTWAFPAFYNEQSAAKKVAYHAEDKEKFTLFVGARTLDASAVGDPTFWDENQLHWGINWDYDLVESFKGTNGYADNAWTVPTAATQINVNIVPSLLYANYAYTTFDRI